jgi:glycosyltransferase involved in cell wall biosynthesis
VDELILVDTGSTDRTVELARRGGAQVTTYEWSDDFAAARNAAAAQAHGAWILVLDADERLDPESGSQLSELVFSDEAAGAGAILASIRSFAIDSTRPLAEHEMPRLYRRGDRVYWSGVVHEELLHVPPGAEHPVPVPVAPRLRVCLNHYGYDSRVWRARAKHARNRTLLESAVRSDPTHARLVLHLAQLRLRDDELESAQSLIRRYLDLHGRTGRVDRSTVSLFTSWVAALARAGSEDALLAVEHEASERNALSPEALDVLAAWSQTHDRLSDARDYLVRALDPSAPRGIVRIEGVGGYRTRIALARVEEQLGHAQAALEQVELAYPDLPDSERIETAAACAVVAARVGDAGAMTRWVERAEAAARPAPPPIGPRASGAPLVTAIVSTYASERFMRGCLEDLEAQTIADQLEIIVVDSGSPERECDVVREFRQRFANIVYLRTDERETLYAAWNRAIAIARGEYLTSANTDDRHRRDALEVLAQTLDNQPEVTLVYADCRRTTAENADFASAPLDGRFHWLDFHPLRLLARGCFVGPQPMWRRNVHAEYGLFDASFVSAGDYEFWLRIAHNRTFLHLREELGLYLDAADSLEHRQGPLAATEEAAARARHRERLFPSRSRPRAPKQMTCRRVVLVCSNALCPERVGRQCHEALLSLGVDVVDYEPVVVDAVGKLQHRGYADLPLDADLILQIDDGLAYPGPVGETPAAYWCRTDLPSDELGPGVSRWDKLVQFDIVFSASQSVAERLDIPWLSAVDVDEPDVAEAYRARMQALLAAI